MAGKPDPSPIRVVIDPNHEPVRVVDQVTFHPAVGPEVNLTLCTHVDVPGGEGFTPAAVVAVRLRLTLGMARALVEGIARQIAMAESAGSTRN